MLARKPEDTPIPAGESACQIHWINTHFSWFPTVRICACQFTEWASIPLGSHQRVPISARSIEGALKERLYLPHALEHPLLQDPNFENLHLPSPWWCTTASREEEHLCLQCRPRKHNLPRSFKCTTYSWNIQRGSSWDTTFSHSITFIHWIVGIIHDQLVPTGRISACQA